MITIIQKYTSHSQYPDLSYLQAWMGKLGLSYLDLEEQYFLNWITLRSGGIIYRKGEREGKYCIDKSINGGVTWDFNLVQLEIDEDSIIKSIDEGIEGYRHVIRDGVYCIDHEIDLVGFEGVEGVNWENLYTV